MRAPVLLVGLGNALAGDDGAGARVAALLAADPRLPGGVEALVAGTDLLRVSHALEGRQHVVLVDALEDPSRPGAVTVHTDADEFDERQGHAHHLSAVQALDLLRCVVPGLGEVPCTWISVAIGEARLSHELSPAVAAAFPELLETVLRTLREVSGQAAC
jgi:hydrogenase maturation protease